MTSSHALAAETGSIDLESLCPLLQVFDMPASLAFYRDVLGFAIHHCAPPVGEVAADHHDWVWLKRGSMNLMLNTAYDPDAVRPPAPEPARFAAHEDTGLYLGCPDVDAAYEYLTSRGVEMEPPHTASYGMRQLYLRDPDGFVICLQWPADS